jgi:phosphopantetheinyl transferase (holo-ACP synthase)
MSSIHLTITDEFPYAQAVVIISIGDAVGGG